ncbi:GntR family transcriptional regulator [Virgisporangium ochraceum]|uniref:GntR family transcriptional regulator n=1 Tax=Virgisporangium ochraceum TaxID=65505 RepID=UPI00194227F7|nr:GntR family transcriptional regulator [Virgisporangium ochraceum]
MSTVAVPATSSGNAAYLRLRRAIVRLELPPSAPVSETHLSDRFGLSKAAVRAALARLRAEGLVLAEPRRGHVIAPLTLRDVREIYDLRVLVEPAGARVAATVLDAGVVDGLVARVGRLSDEGGSTVEDFLAVNRDIHVAVAAAAGNSRQEALVERLLDESERAIAAAFAAGVPGGAPRIREEHLTLLTALRARDPDAAAAAMAAAISRFRDDLLRILAGTAPVLDAQL